MLCSDHDIKDVLENNESDLQKLIYPKQSHMDFNIACALYLASKAKDCRMVDIEKWFSSETFLESKRQIQGIIDEKSQLDLSTLKENNTQAKSNDYKMATAEIKKVPVECYLSDKVVTS